VTSARKSIQEVEEMLQSSVRVRVLIAVATTVVAAAMPASAAARRCGRVEIPTRELGAKVHVVHGTTSCRAARRQIAAAFGAEDTRHWDGYANPDGVFWHVRGWRCFIGLADTQTFCFRGHKRVDGSVRTDDGWTF
jgi:hypothetical protein